MTDPTPLSVQSPSDAPKGGVVVLQEAFGVNEHIEDVCRRLAGEGWLAVAPHLFHRTGDPKLEYDITVARPHMEALTRDDVLADLDAALAHLEEAGLATSRIGVVGFCMGGSIALTIAAERQVGAAVTFYGGGVRDGRFGFPSGIESTSRLRAPWLGLYGDLDQAIPIDDVEELRAAAATAPVPTEVVRYPDAGHGFHCDQRASFHAPSSADAWARTLAWFDRYLVA